MKKVFLGKSDLEVAVLGLGTMGMSEFYGEPDENESIATLNAALDNGINFLDTADVYGTGHNELLLGKALKDRWDEVVLATKFGFVRENGKTVGVNGRPEYVKKACEASLQRLGIDCIDLYYLHRKDPQTPIEESVGAMAELVKEGKVRYLGLSEVSAETLRKAHTEYPITALQSEYSLWSFDIEEAVLPACRELGISLVAYSPLGRGFLTGQIKKFEDFDENDFRKTIPRFQGENFQKNLDLVAELEALAAKKDVKAAHLALAWLFAQGNDIVPIPGTKRRKYLMENLASVIVQLSQKELDRIAEITKEIAGTRYSEMGMRFTNL